MPKLIYSTLAKISRRDNINGILANQTNISLIAFLDDVKDLQIFSQQFQPKFARTTIVSYLTGSQTRKIRDLARFLFFKIIFKHFLRIFIHLLFIHFSISFRIITYYTRTFLFFFLKKLSHVFPISRSIFSISGIFLFRKKKKIGRAFYISRSNRGEKKCLLPKGMIIIVIVCVSSSCALVFFRRKKKKKKKPVPENAPFPETMAATYEFKLPSTGG